jgi:hypothetical protein
VISSTSIDAQADPRPSAKIIPFPVPCGGSDGLTAERLRELLDYDPATGEFRNRVQRGGRGRAGDVAGCVNDRGYQRIGVDGQRHRAHRLAWLYDQGTWPAGMLDHIDGDRVNNRIGNLRIATRAQNAANRRPRAGGTSQFKGVSWDKDRGEWRARIKVDGRWRHLGRFTNPEDAARAYDLAAVEAFGAFALTNAALGLLDKVAA